MAGEIIRQGDPTSHGGRVIEGSPSDICHGKPIAFMGHHVSCPRCKGIFPIIEGADLTTFYGRGVALAGMKTACGAVLIATQLTDTVEWGRGSSESSSAGTGKPAATFADANTSGAEHQAADSIVEEHFYALVSEDGKPAEGYLYDLRSGETLRAKAAGYAEGATVRIPGTQPTSVVTWLAKDGGAKS